MTRLAAEEYLDALAAHGIEHLFVNPGTDFAPIVEQIRNNGGEAIGILTDVENEVDVISRFAQTAAHWGTPDIAVNCAAMTNDGPLTEFTESEWDEVLSVDLKWVFFCTREGFMPPPPVCDAAATSNTEH